jgi:hypothetical protein
MDVNERKRVRYRTDPEYRARKREYQRNYHKMRYRTDPEYRARKREYQRNYHKMRYRTDPEFRAGHMQRNRNYRKRLRQRFQEILEMSDEEYLELCRIILNHHPRNP